MRRRFVEVADGAAQAHVLRLQRGEYAHRDGLARAPSVLVTEGGGYKLIA
jgi:hypothetical protein